MTLQEQQQAVAAHLVQFHDVSARLNWLVGEARRRPLMPAELRTDAHRIEGCLARLWLASECRDGKCYFQSESDSLVVKALAGMLCELYSGRTPEEILAHDPSGLFDVGLPQHVTRNRRQGLAHLLDAMRAFAQAQIVSPMRGAPASG